MPADTLSVKLTVYHDGQFWIGFFERQDHGKLWLARVVFGPEPSLAQIAELVSGPDWRRLRFLPAGLNAERPTRPAANPKRRQREAAREAHATAPSTRSQDAMKAAIEDEKRDSAMSWRERRAQAAERRWEQRVAKRKEKKRGH